MPCGADDRAEYDGLMNESSSRSSVGMRILAVLVLAVCAWILLKVIIHIALAVATTVAIIVAIVAVIWAIRVL